MNHLVTRTIETERLILRRFSKDDAQAMFDNWASDAEVTKFMTWPPYQSVEGVACYLEFVENSYANGDLHWAIELKEIGEPVGAISVVSVNEAVKSVEIGYGIGRNWWHSGITSEAFAAVIKFLFENTDVNRIEAKHDTRNVNSGRVMNKCGLKYEGTLRRAGLNNQGVCDSAVYSILREEYENEFNN